MFLLSCYCYHHAQTSCFLCAVCDRQMEHEPFHLHPHVAVVYQVYVCFLVFTNIRLNFPPVWNSYMKMTPRSVTRSALPWKLLLGLSIHYPAVSSDLLCRPYCNISSSWGSGRPGHWQKRNLNLAMLGETSATPSVVTKIVTSFEGLQALLWGNLQSCFLVIE